MKKSDLENRMVVELRDGERYLVVGKIIMRDNCWLPIISYTENMLFANKNPETNKNLDIMKIYDKVLGLKQIGYTKLLWERKEKPIYTEGEIAILKALNLLGFERIERKTTDILYATKYMVSLLLKYSLFQDIKRCETKLIKEMLEETNNGGIK